MLGLRHPEQSGGVTAIKSSREDVGYVLLERRAGGRAREVGSDIVSEQLGVFDLDDGGSKLLRRSQPSARPLPTPVRSMSRPRLMIVTARP